ncbi:MAG: Hpt domain-containing protein [Pirellulales bacterium]
MSSLLELEQPCMPSAPAPNGVGAEVCKKACPAATAAAEHPTPLDYPQLVRRCMGKLELVERLLSSFEERVPKELVAIHDSLAAGDVPRLARLAHQFKGTTANVSAPELQAIAVRMDGAAREGRFPAVAQCLNDITAAWQRFQQARLTFSRKVQR